MSDLDLEVDILFLAVLAGVVANGSRDDWEEVYLTAKIGSEAIRAYMLDAALQAEVEELQKDVHGRSHQSD